MKKTNKQAKKSNLISVVKNTAIVAVTSIAIVNTMLISATKIARAKNPSISIPTAPKFVLSKMVQSIENIGKNNIEETASSESNSENAVATTGNSTERSTTSAISSSLLSKVSKSNVIRRASSNTESTAYLSSIKIDGNELTGFSSTKFDYEETVTNTDNVLTIERINTNEQVDVSEAYDVSTKIKTLTITVTSANGSNSATYTVKIINSSVTTYIPTTFDDDTYLSQLDNDSIIGKIKNINESGNTTITVSGVDGNGNSEEKSYDLDVIVYNGDLTLDGTTAVTGATLNNKVYEFGNASDCATSTTYATRMVVLKVNGNLTINSGVTLTSTKNASGYGGPKGMTVYCTGTVTNNGTISMTARGAKAVGENVYLWKNRDGSFEYVPAVGGSGGRSLTGSSYHASIVGNVTGSTGTNRRTGGGGGGFARAWYSTTLTSPRGGNGTSYSGGSGAGSYMRHNGGYAQPPFSAMQGSDVGGKGGDSYVYWDTGLDSISGGVGNPGGRSSNSSATQTSRGTGGLLTIYADKLENNSQILSNGSSPNPPTYATYRSSGAASGAGSINIFEKKIGNYGTINANGGISYNSGSGGNGSISIGKLINSKYISYNKKENANIQDIEISAGKLSHSLTENDTDYTIELDPEEYKLSISATPEVNTAKATSVDEFYVPVGTTTKQITVTAEDGSTKKTYTFNVTRKASTNTKLKGITINGTEIENFDPNKLDYDISMPYEENNNKEIKAIKARDEQTVVGEGTYEVSYDEKLVTLKVTAEDGVTTAIYNLYLKCYDTTLLKSCTIKDQDFGDNFDSNTFNYDYEVTNGIVTLNITATPYDPDCTVKIKGAGYLKEGENIVTITVSKDGLEPSIYTINVTREPEVETQSFTYSYTGKYQTFIAPQDGYYQFEVWGARGGYGHGFSAPGKGAYTVGYRRLTKGTTLYIYVGQAGNDNDSRRTSWNGGGIGGYDNLGGTENGGAGGGATDIRYIVNPTSDQLKFDSEDGLNSRIIVAGGGGGAGGWTYSNGLPGGQDLGNNVPLFGSAGLNLNSGGGGSGGGYYGGKNMGARSCEYYVGQGGAGGTSYANTTNADLLKLKKVSFADGASTMPTYDGMNVMTGNNSNGYAKITLMNEPSNDNLLKQLQIKYADEEHTINIGEQDILDKTMSYDDSEYTIKLQPEDDQVTIYGIQDHIAAKVDGNGTFDIKAGTTPITLTVTAENEDTKTYTINVVRDASSNSKPDNIKINGIIDAFIKEGSDYGKLKNTATGEETEFDPDIHEYSMTLPARQKKISFDVTKGHNYETVEGDGEYTLQDNDNTFTIKITSEDGTSTSEYTYHIFHDMTGNCLLSELHVTNLENDIEFEQETLEYYVSVPNELDHLDITAIPESEKATVRIIGNTDLQVGLNEVYVIVNAENGEQLVYVIHAYRMKSGNTFLSKLEVSEVDGDNPGKVLSYSPSFNEVYEDYYFTETVPNNVTKINIVAEPADVHTTVTGAGEQNLKTGVNIFDITTTAEDGSQGTYTVKVEREKSSDNYLATLSADEGDLTDPDSESTDKIDFNKEKLNYNIKVSADVNKLTLHYTTEDSTAKVQVEGNENLKTGGNIVKIIVTAENGDERTYMLSVEKEKSSNNNLSALWTDKGKLDPEFDKDTTEYTVEVENDVEMITLSATKEKLSSTISGTGTYPLTVGENPLSVVVTAENGDKKVYVVNVVRKKNSNAYLKSLSLNKGQVSIDIGPSFDKNTTYYKAYVPYTYYTININAEPEVSTTTVTNIGEVSLNQGENVIIVRSTAEDGTEMDYTLTITRVDPGVDPATISDEARLESLVVKNHTFTESFDKDKYTYYLTTDDSSLNMVITPIEKNATYDVKGNENFKKGTNEVQIVVTAPNGLATKTYTIVVTKNSSNNNNLDSLKVVGYALSPEFNRSTTSYTVNVPADIKVVMITATAEDPQSTITGTGKLNLKTGRNVQNVVVTSESGKVKTYTIVINKAASTDNYLINLDVSKGTLTPSFDKDTTKYTVEVPYEDNVIDVIANVEDETATVTGNGDHDLAVGLNTIKVNVTAESGSVKTYEIDVTRKTAISALLTKLEEANYDISPKFNSNTFEYSITVDNEVTSLNLITETLDPGATVEITGNENFKVGLNIVNIKVTSSDRSKVENYVLDVTRQVYANNFLSYIALSSGTLTPKFNKTTMKYSAEVGAETESITIEAEPEVTSTTVTGTGTFKLNKGLNTFKIKSTSSTGIARTYIVNITRKKSSNNYLKSLKALVGSEQLEITPAFNKNTNNYEVTVPAETSVLNLSAIAEDENAKVTNDGYVSINSTKTVQNIIVTAENGEERTYTVTINRAPSTVCDLTDLIPSSGALEPSFSYDTTEYNLELGNADNYLSFEAVKLDQNATVTGAESEPVANGKSTRKVVVTAEDGVTTKTYTINITRNRTDDARLKELKLKDYTLSPDFNMNTYSYTIKVPNSKKTFSKDDIESALPYYDNSTVTYDDEIKLSTKRANEFDIYVTAKDGITKATYKIMIERELSNNPNVVSIKPSCGTLNPTFDASKNTYSLELGNDDNYLSFDVQTEDDQAVIDGASSQEVPNKESTRTIKVTSEDGSSSVTYTINVNRIRTNDPRLETLEINTNYTLNKSFDKDTYEYTLTVPNAITTFTKDDVLQAIPCWNNSTVTLADSVSDLSTKKATAYKIHVLAVDGVTSKDYILNVIREKSNDNNLSDLKVKLTDGTEIPLDATFDKDTLEYSVTLPMGTKVVNIEATKEESEASISGDGEQNMTATKTDFPVVVTAENGEKKTYIIHASRIPDTNANLKSLSTDVGTISPDFDKDTTLYTMTVEGKTDKLNISAEPESEFATVEGIGETELSIGNNTKQIIVTAEDGTTKLYQITIKRKSNDARLKSLKIRNYEFDQEFDKDKYEYTLTVPNDKFQTTAEEFEAKPVYNTTEITNDGTITLSTLEVNTYNIYTKSEDGTDTRTYTIKITRQKSSDSKLASLAVEGCELTEKFEPDKTEYTAYVPKGTESFDTSRISYKTRDEYAVATPSTTSSLDLSGGKHKFYITVRSQDESSVTIYTLNIAYEPSHNAYLKSLTVDEGKFTPDFSRDVTEYNLSIGRRQDYVTISAEPEDPYAKVVEGTGKFNITKENTQILVRVKAEDGKYRIYILNVTKDMTPLTMISGKITTDNIAGKHTATVYMYKAGTDELVDKVQTKDDGTYSFDIQNEVESKMDIVVQKPGYLDYKVLNVPVKPHTTTTIGDYKMIAGNVVKTTDVTYGVNMSDTTKVNNLIKAYGVQTADDLKKVQEINVDDLTLIKSHYGTITSQNKATNSTFDFNEDGVVNDEDTKILKKNYGLFEKIVDYPDL